jgi:hypothetical protein
LKDIWSRDTQWHQGSVLSAESARKLKLQDSDAFLHIAISHDCDIANENVINEPQIEFMRGKLAYGGQGKFCDAQNARTLRIHIQNSGIPQDIELKIRDRFFIEKKDLLPHTPESECFVQGKNLVVLQRWLAARYWRSAFSNSFEDRLEKVEKKIDKALKGLTNEIEGVYFRVDDGINKELDNSEVHELRMLLVYEASASNEHRKLIDEAAKIIQNAFVTAYLCNTVWQEIELVGNCDLISTSVFSYEDQRSFKRWRLDHRSLQASVELPKP